MLGPRRLTGLLLLVFPATLGNAATITIGGLYTASWAPDDARGMQLAVDAVNADAALLSGHTLALAPRDDGGDGWAALRATCDLARAGVHAIVGPPWSSTSLAIAPLCEALAIPCISHSATSASLSDRAAYPYFARVRGPDTMQAAALVGIVESFSYTKICILHRDDDYGTQGAVETRKEAKRRGISVKFTEGFAAATSNATAAVTDAAAAGCRVFVMWCIECGKAMQSVRDAGYVSGGEYLWLMSEGCGTSESFDDSVHPGLLHALIGSLCLAPATPPGAGRAAFLQRWDTAANGQPSVTALYAYDAVLAAAHALGAAPAAAAAPPLAVDATGDACLPAPARTQGAWGSGAALRDALGGAAFQGATGGGADVALSASYERTTAAFTVTNVQSHRLDSGTFWEVGDVNVSESGGGGGGGRLTTRLAFHSTLQWGAAPGTPPPNDALLASVRVVIVISPPFNMIHPACADTCLETVTMSCGNQCYEGYSIDVLRRLVELAGFDGYEITHVRRGYGFTRVLRDFVAAGGYDFAAGDWTATASRSAFIDTSYPYYDTGLAIMKKKKAEAEQTEELFSPFNNTVWWTLLLYMLGFTLLIWFYEAGFESCAKWVRRCLHKPTRGAGNKVASIEEEEEKKPQKEKKKRRPHRGSVGAFAAMGMHMAELRRRDEEAQEGGWWVFHTLYGALTAFVRTPQISPVTVAGKILISGYMFSNFIIIAAYTATLAAHLTIKRIPKLDITGSESIGSPGSGKPISFDQVCLQSIGGSIDAYWHKTWGENAACFNCANGARPIYDTNPETNPGLADNGWTHELCVDEMRDPTSPVEYIVGDEAMIRYQVLTEDCDFEMVDKLFYLQGYSLMINPRKEFLSTALTTAILALREEQYLDDLNYKYFNKGTCTEEADATGADAKNELEQMSIEQFKGVGILFSTFALASVVAFACEKAFERKRAKFANSSGESPPPSGGESSGGEEESSNDGDAVKSDGKRGKEEPATTTPGGSSSSSSRVGGAEAAAAEAGAVPSHARDQSPQTSESHPVQPVEWDDL